MSSINTNFAALTALQNLNQTNADLNTTQNRISTGLRVADASDNAAYFSIATTLRSDNSALSAVTDSLGFGAATVDVATTGLNAVIDVVDEIKSKLVTAREPGVDRAKVQSEITQLQEQLVSITSSSAFNGENFLSVDSSVTGFNATKTIVASFNRATDNSVSVGTIQISLTSTKLFDASASASGILDAETALTNAGTNVSVANFNISAFSDSAADLGDLEQIIGIVDGAIQSITTAASDLGSASKRIDLQRTFISGLQDAIDRGISTLVDADLNAESTKLNALQVQQQLGVQALAIANSNSQNILSLFR